MFECKVCREKEKRINYLEKQVDRLLLRLGVPDAEVYNEQPAQETNEDHGKIRYGE